MKKNTNFQEPYYGDKKITLTVPQLLIGVIVTFVLAIGILIIFVQPSKETGTDAYSTTSRYTNGLPSRLVEEMSASYSFLKKYYVGDIDEDKLIDGALSGFVSGLGDQYTSYMNASEMLSLQETTHGEFEGIGVEIEVYNDYIRVVSPIDSSPAYKAGLQSGDLIIAVDGQDIKGKSTTEVAKMVRGKKGTSVTLTMDRSGSRFEVSIVRDTIPLHTVKGEINGQVGVLRISSFSENTYDELVTQIKQLRTNGAKSFVIDVRSNPGGLLDAVEKIVNIFVNENQVMFKMEDNNGTIEHRASNQLGTFKVTEPIVVLIDNGSASAAEIFAAAIKELGRGQVIGQTSFGKGTAQTIRNLSQKTGIKITYSKWLTPNGNWIHQKGITPDVTIALPAFSNYAYVNTQFTPQVNESSDATLNLQKILVALGYNLSLTGVYDEPTAQVIKQFNQVNGINHSQFTAETASKINELMRQKILDNDTQLQEALNRIR